MQSISYPFLPRNINNDKSELPRTQKPILLFYLPFKVTFKLDLTDSSQVIYLKKVYGRDTRRGNGRHAYPEGFQVGSWTGLLKKKKEKVLFCMIRTPAIFCLHCAQALFKVWLLQGDFEQILWWSIQSNQSKEVHLFWRRAVVFLRLWRFF